MAGAWSALEHPPFQSMKHHVAPCDSCISSQRSDLAEFVRRYFLERPVTIADSVAQIAKRRRDALKPSQDLSNCWGTHLWAWWILRSKLERCQG